MFSAVSEGRKSQKRRSDRRTCTLFCERNFARERSPRGQSATATVRNPMGQLKHALFDVIKSGRTSLVQARTRTVTVSENVVADGAVSWERCRSL